MSYFFQKCKKIIGTHRLRVRDVAYGKLPNLKIKLAHVVQHILQGFIVKKIEGESTEASNLGHICRSGSVG